MQKAFKFTLIPNHNQEVLINKTIGCARYVYNRFLALKKELYDSEGKTLNYNACSQQLTILKKEIEWLNEVDKFALQNSLNNLETAYKNFFADLKKIKGKKGVGFPKFKKKHGCKQSYKTNLTNNNIQVIENRLKLPKLGWIKFHSSQDITGKLVNVTITRTTSGKYIASILCEIEIEKYPQVTQNIGLDLGLKSYIVTSVGEVVDNPKYYRTQTRKLRLCHKKLSRSVKGSSNRVKAKIKLARTYERITNLRDDFLHKLSTRLIKENSIICIEDLRVTNMVKNHKLALSISDASWTKFTNMLEYKALWHDRMVQKVGTFYPSSQTCNHCGFINPLVKDLKLREWSCPSCSNYNLRDVNASLNILSEGLRILTAAVGAPDAIYACGELISPEVIQAEIVEAGITRQQESCEVQNLFPINKLFVVESMKSYLAAAIQLTSVSNLQKNLAQAEELIDLAVRQGAELVGLPENFSYMGEEKDRLAQGDAIAIESEKFLKKMAQRFQITILGGSFPLPVDNTGKVYNTTLLIDPSGQELARYYKVHLFDVDVPDGNTYRESSTVVAGTQLPPVYFSEKLGNLGLSICYDVRFPELYRHLADKGADVIFIPAAFTAFTGKDHWQVLLQARAIENTAYVIAPAQTGNNYARRLTHGHAVIIDPWGVILADAGEKPGIAIAEIKPTRLEQVRRQMPSLQHRVF